MSAKSIDPLSAAFAALADPTRRAILARLLKGETSVGDLVKPFPISGPAISRHLRVLENARLIERKVDAQWRICRLNPPGLRAADDWLSQYRAFWEHSLDRLVEVLEQDDDAQPPPIPSNAAARNKSRQLSTRQPRTVAPRTSAVRLPPRAVQPDKQHAASTPPSAAAPPLRRGATGARPTRNTTRTPSTHKRKSP